MIGVGSLGPRMTSCQNFAQVKGCLHRACKEDSQEEDVYVLTLHTGDRYDLGWFGLKLVVLHGYLQIPY